jgi:hypothetical protein
MQQGQGDAALLSKALLALAACQAVPRLAAAVELLTLGAMSHVLPDTVDGLGGMLESAG